MKGLVQTVLDEPALGRLKRAAQEEGLSVAAHLRRLVLASQGTEPSGISRRITRLEARVSELEKARVRSRT